jgi:hypothetical protein
MAAHCTSQHQRTECVHAVAGAPVCGPLFQIEDLQSQLMALQRGRWREDLGLDAPPERPGRKRPAHGPAEPPQPGEAGGAPRQGVPRDAAGDGALAGAAGRPPPHGRDPAQADGAGLAPAAAVAGGAGADASPGQDEQLMPSSGIRESAEEGERAGVGDLEDEEARDRAAAEQLLATARPPPQPPLPPQEDAPREDAGDPRDPQARFAVGYAEAVVVEPPGPLELLPEVYRLLTLHRDLLGGGES